MANLIYFTPASLDSYIADETGNLDLVGARRGGICVNRGRTFLHRKRVWSGNSTRRWFAS